METRPYFLTPASSGGQDRWMISYSDLVTLLLVFFVAVSAHLWLGQKAKPATAPPAAETQPSRAMEEIQRRMQARLGNGNIDLKLDQRGLIISLPQAILFPSGSDEVSTEALPMLEGIAAVVRDLPNQVVVAGHADAVPIHSLRFKDNWELSAARSIRILQALTERYGVAPEKLSVASFGPYRPKGSNEAPEGRASNRRVEILVLEEGKTHAS